MKKMTEDEQKRNKSRQVDQGIRLLLCISVDFFENDIIESIN